MYDEINYMNHTTPLNSVKDQIASDIIYYEILPNNFLQCPWFPSPFFHESAIIDQLWAQEAVCAQSCTVINDQMKEAGIHALSMLAHALDKKHNY